MKCFKTPMSVILSLCILTLLAVILVTLTVTLPAVFDIYYELVDADEGEESSYPDRSIITVGENEDVRTVSLTLLYVAIVPAYISVIFLYILLINIRRGNTFIPANVRILGIIAICCFCECVVFALIGRYFMISFGISLAALFIGSILTVVRDVINSAVKIKAENDFTV